MYKLNEQDDFLNESIIIYGPKGSGKYTISLNIIKKFSKSNLKYERKINFLYNKKHNIMFKISDIHYEIDMELLGCQSNMLWNDIYYRIIDIISTKKKRNGIILCKNFDKIKDDLLKNFYSYMQRIINTNMNISFILIINNISYLPDNIINICSIINVPKPSKKKYESLFKVDLSGVGIKNITNIKGILTNNILSNNKIPQQIYNSIKDFNDINYHILRTNIYNMLVFNLDIYECLWFIFEQIMKNHNLNEENIFLLLNKTYEFLKYYNNNYRPIYHLEKIILEYFKIIHNL